MSRAAGPLVVTSLDVVGDCLPLGRAMDLIEEALGDRRAASIVPVTLGLDDGVAFRILAGGTGDAAVVRFGPAGKFWFTGRAHLNHWAAVFEPSTGELRALLRFPFTAMRVAATLGVAARSLVHGPVPVTMIGSGNYSFGTLEAVHLGTGIEALTVVSRTPANAAKLAARVSDELSVPAETAPDVRTAVAGAAVVVVGTDSPEPVLRADWLSGNQLILSYGQPTELERSVYLAADHLVASDVTLELESATVGRHPLAGRDGQPERRFTRLGDLLHSGAEGLIVVRDGGGGVGDAALAAGLAAEAERRGLTTSGIGTSAP